MKMNSNLVSYLLRATELQIAKGAASRTRFGPGKSQRRENVCAPVRDQTTTQSRWQAEGAHFGSDQPLCSRGHEATTTREIAAPAGCAEGLIHRYFGGTSRLLFNIVELHVPRTRPQQSGPACSTLEAEIRKLMDWQLDHLRWDRLLQLTPQEFSLLEYLCRNEGRVVTRTMILDHVWRMRIDPATNVVDVHIYRLRSKVDHDTPRPLIHTIRGVGYVLKYV
jgi:AcrR family transcriptional regulator